MPSRAGAGVELRTLLGPAHGSRQLLQATVRIRPDASSPIGHPGADAVVYVVRGAGEAVRSLHGDSCALRAGSAALVPAKVPCEVRNTGRSDLVLLLVLSPPPFDGAFHMEARDLPIVTIHEDDRDVLPAGEDRDFRLLIDPASGARTVTQFVGFIRRSKAPPHMHTYEEAIHIVDGEGVMHVDGREEPISPGTSIFLPPGTPHCLENRGVTTLKLLGVFSPPGSPAARRDA